MIRATNVVKMPIMTIDKIGNFLRESWFNIKKPNATENNRTSILNTPLIISGILPVIT
jgi:hypothetical protein